MSDHPPDGYLICMPASSPAYFADDSYGACCRCGVRVRFRPYAEGTPVCLACARVVIVAAEAAGHTVECIGLSDEARREAELYFSTPGGKA
jgi:hypothetical protein